MKEPLSYPHFTDGEAEVQQDLCSLEVARLGQKCWQSGARTLMYRASFPPRVLKLLVSFANLLKAVYLY